MRFVLVILFLYPVLVKSQLYKAEFVTIKEYYEFKIVGKEAYLDYNLTEQYADLIFNDSLYHYQIKKTGKPLDSKRFVVWFKNTKDTMLWNVSEEGDFIFAFSINETLYWFRNISNPLREEFDWVKMKTLDP
jgi:hypothetical protein